MKRRTKHGIISALVLILLFSRQDVLPGSLNTMEIWAMI